MTAASITATSTSRRWSAANDWPHTTRVMPWLLAAFAVMLFVLPFDVAALPVSLPVDARLDRVVLGVIFVFWICALASGGRLSPRLRWTPIHLALLVFFAAAIASVALNLETLVILEEHMLALKKLALLASFVALFFFVASVVRPSEVEAFTRLLLGLACITAIGVLWESQSRSNPFYDWSRDLLPGFSVPPAPVTQGLDEIGRPNITGPTAHGLAVATMMAMVLPFALLLMMNTRRRLFGILACALLMAAAVATLRKTAFVAPMAVIVAMTLYRPRAMLKLAPFGVAIVIAIHFLSPGSLGSVGSQLFTSKLTAVGSTQDRVEDYEAVRLDIVDKLQIGRGYGTYGARRYRFLDNMYLQILITTGVLGLIAYLLVMIAVGVTAHLAVRARGPTVRRPALAAVAATLAFAVTNALYDTLAFPHAPYLFLLIAGLFVASIRVGVSDSRPEAPNAIARW